MKPEQRDDFLEVLQGVFAFYRHDLSPTVVDIWWNAMQAYELASITKAFGQHCMNPDCGQFVPKPADVVRMLGGTTSDSALTAWSTVSEAVRKLGAYYSVVFDDPLIHRVIDEMGGWILLCHTTLKDWPFKQNEFIGRYRAYKMRGEVPVYPAKLIGIIDGENGVKGYPADDSYTRLVGNHEAARRVLTAGTNVPRLTVSKLAPALPAPEKQ